MDFAVVFTAFRIGMQMAIIGYLHVKFEESEGATD